MAGTTICVGPSIAEMREQQQSYSSEASIRWTLENVLANMEKLTAPDIEPVVRDSLAGHALAKKMRPGVGMQKNVSKVVSSEGPFDLTS